jgi:hypothetical protein
MKKSVIFWNIIAVIAYSLLIIFSPLWLVITTLIVGTVLGIVAIVSCFCDYDCSPIFFSYLNSEGFIHWWIYITPIGLCWLLIEFLIRGSYACVVNFNKFLNKL